MDLIDFCRHVFDPSPYQMALLKEIEKNKKFVYPARSIGKSIRVRAEIRWALNTGQNLIVGVPNQREAVEKWSREFPDALISLVGTWGIRFHKRR